MPPRSKRLWRNGISSLARGNESESADARDVVPQQVLEAAVLRDI